MGTIRKKTAYLKNSQLLPMIRESRKSFYWFPPDGVEGWDAPWIDVESLPDASTARTDSIYRIRDLTRLPPKQVTKGAIEMRRQKYGVSINYSKREHFVPTPFAPLVHYRVVAGEWKVVAIPFWDGHEFVLDGALVPDLVAAIYYLAEKYANSSKFRGYSASWRDWLITEALDDCTRNCLNFDANRGDNPFAYLTQIVHHAFLKPLKKLQQENEYQRVEMQEAERATRGRVSGFEEINLWNPPSGS